MGILESFIMVAPYINKLTSSDFAVSVCDLEKCLYYIPGEKLNHKLEVNTPHIKGSATYRCLETKQRVIQRVDKEVFGFPYIAIAVPLEENGRLVGVVCFSESVEKQEMLFEIAETLFNSLEEMKGITDSFYDNTNNLNSTVNDLNVAAKESYDKIQESDNILGFIREVSRQTNFLGLNAGIEASRVGQQGAGFTVVANEIRNLATKTDSYVKKVDTILKQINESTRVINKRMDILLENSTKQVASIEDIQEFTDKIRQMSEELRKQAELLN